MYVCICTRTCVHRWKSICRRLRNAHLLPTCQQPCVNIHSYHNIEMSRLCGKCGVGPSSIKRYDKICRMVGGQFYQWCGWGLFLELLRNWLLEGPSSYLILQGFPGCYMVTSTYIHAAVNIVEHSPRIFSSTGIISLPTTVTSSIGGVCSKRCSSNFRRPVHTTYSGPILGIISHEKHPN